MQTRKRAVRFLGVEVEELPNNRCRAVVTLARPSGERYEGVAKDAGSKSGAMRAAVLAMMQAVLLAVGADSDTLELHAVRAIQAGDVPVVIVAFSRREGNATHKHAGSCVAEQGWPRAAALAVLSALNRPFDTG